MRKEERSYKKDTRELVLIIFFVFLALYSLLLNFEEIKVIDGDTFIYKGKKIRIIGIDCPEIKKQKEWFINRLLEFGKKVNITCLKVYAIKAKKFLDEIVKKFKIRIKPVRLDEYNRVLAYVFYLNELG